VSCRDALAVVLLQPRILDDFHMLARFRILQRGIVILRKKSTESLLFIVTLGETREIEVPSADVV
jgi:hypothetical protein